MISMTTRSLRILVVDDDPAMVGAITALVGTEGHQVITAYDGLTAVKRFRDEHPDLVLLDLAMPGPDGFSVAGQMRAVGQAPILVVSGESGEAAKVRALGIGADDYLTKPFGKAELLARIAAVMRRVDRPGASGGPAGPLEAGALVLEPGRHEARVGDVALALTPTEFRLLEALVRADGDIVPHLQLARAGWPAESDPDLLWLKPHLARLRAKVEAAGGPHVVAVRGVGYRIVVEGVAARLTRRRSAGSASDGDRDRATTRVVRGVGARDPAAAGVAPAERIEVEPRVTGRGQATATRGTGDGRALPASDGERSVKLGLGRMDHGDHLVVLRSGGWRGGEGRGRGRVTLPQHDAKRRFCLGPRRRRQGCGTVAARWRGSAGELVGRSSEYMPCPGMYGWDDEASLSDIEPLASSNRPPVGLSIRPENVHHDGIDIAPGGSPWKCCSSGSSSSPPSSPWMLEPCAGASTPATPARRPSPLTPTWTSSNGASTMYLLDYEIGHRPHARACARGRERSAPGARRPRETMTRSRSVVGSRWPSRA